MLLLQMHSASSLLFILADLIASPSEILSYSLYLSTIEIPNIHTFLLRALQPFYYVSLLNSSTAPLRFD
jgi:hypothetical protein